MFFNRIHIFRGVIFASRPTNQIKKENSGCLHNKQQLQHQKQKLISSDIEYGFIKCSCLLSISVSVRAH